MLKFKKLMHKALGYYNETVILGTQLIVKDPDSSSGERTHFDCQTKSKIWSNRILFETIGYIF